VDIAVSATAIAVAWLFSLIFVATQHAALETTRMWTHADGGDESLIYTSHSDLLRMELKMLAFVALAVALRVLMGRSIQWGVLMAGPLFATLFVSGEFLFHSDLVDPGKTGGSSDVLRPDDEVTNYTTIAVGIAAGAAALGLLVGLFAVK
jgi:hypothetical protein